MGILQRLRRVTVGRIESFLARVEDPEVVFPQLLREMEGQISAAIDAEAQAAAAVKRAERELGQLRQRMDRMSKGARLALAEGDEKTAREAVVAQIDAENGVQRQEQILERARAAHDKATATREQLRAQLAELKAKKEEIITRARVARTRAKTQATVHGSASSAESILDAVARLESSVEESEAELDIQEALREGATVETTLDKRLKDLGREAEIESRLDAMRKELGSDEA